MNDVRWFGPNRYTTLVVEELRSRGLSVATDGEGPARLALSMSGTTALQAWKYASRYSCPLILYLWDLPPRATGSGKFDPVISLGGYLIRVPRLGRGFGRRRGFYSRLRYIASQAHELWVPSQMTQELVRARFRVDSRRVPYCYDSGLFQASPTPKDVPPVLLTVGRLQAHKNQAATIRAASRIATQVRVHIVGRGPELHRLQELARTLRVHCRIDTEMNDAGVADAYRRARVAVCPSRFEGFGLTPIEAIASGTPVVASDIPPHREFVGPVARLVPLDDDDVMAERVSRALEEEPPVQAAISHLTVTAAADRFVTHLMPLLK